MNLATLARNLLPALVGILAVIHPFRALAEDIDIFVAGSGGSSVANVLIILDNTSNWATQSQDWPGNDTQGQSELKAIKTAIANLNEKVNVGLMMGAPQGGGNCCTGGYIRYAMQPMTSGNKSTLTSLLDSIYGNINAPENKQASSTTYSSVLFDAFKYFGGYTSPIHASDGVAGTPVSATAFGVPVFATPASMFSAVADPHGYTSAALTNYLPPTAAADACGGQNFIIYVGNKWANADTAPQQNMKTFLEGVGGRTKQLELPGFTVQTETTTTTIGPTAACYANNKNGLDACISDVASACDPQYTSCTCALPTTGGCAKNNEVHYTLQGAVSKTNTTPTNTTCVPGTTGCGDIRWADEWTDFLYRTDVSSAPGQQNVLTYTIDVFNKGDPTRPNQAGLMYSMASWGGGKYFQAKSQSDIEKALGAIFAEINSVNSTFASASLPVSTTNRALNVNEVYMGIFRPDPRSRPLWYGNLKRYKIANFSGDYKLADVNGLDTVSATTGFITDCATSWWTNDSGKYWKDVSVDPSPAGGCLPPSTTYDPFSDAPDGPKVEKGGVAEILRQGNVGAGTPTWSLNRKLYTKNFETFNAASTGMAAADVDFVTGLNVNALGATVTYNFADPSGTATDTTIRPTIHGGVVHSRPLPVNYGSSIGTVLYYGSDDGTYRAANAADGRELWAYVAPEFYSTLPRLRQNSPLLKYSFVANVVVDPPAQPKNYHFDGSTGLWQKAGNSQVWIYPTMRRGGRMIYAFDVTAPGSPSLKWKQGCPNLTDDTGCSADFEGIGQTWSTPNLAPVNVDGAVNGAVKPVVIVGGGYDNCEDGAAADPCNGAKGNVIYVIDADSGELLRKFDTDGRVVSDVAVIDIDYDGVADYAYVGDTRGNLYRIAFGRSKTAPLAKAAWTKTKIGKTAANSNRKFLYQPALIHGYDKATGKTYIYVALGSGDREQPLVSQYPYVNNVKNRFYVYMDDVSATDTANLDDTTTMNGYTSNQDCGASLTIPGGNKAGWFMELPKRGEQTVTSAVIVGGLVAFSTNRAVPSSEGVCAPLGEARGYIFNLFSASGAIGATNGTCGGEASSVFVGGGLPPSPVVANVEIDGKVETIVIGVANLEGKSSSAIQTEVGFSLKPQKRNRIFWRQEGDN
jgi:type IV pilus assembly protein PilY1